MRIEGDEVAPAVRDRLSVHQIGVADLLDALRWLDAYPRRLVLLGLVPASLGLELARSPAVEAGIPRLIEQIVAEAGEMGYAMRPRSSPAAAPGRAARALGLWDGDEGLSGPGSLPVSEMREQGEKGRVEQEGRQPDGGGCRQPEARNEPDAPRAEARRGARRVRPGEESTQNEADQQ